MDARENGTKCTTREPGYHDSRLGWNGGTGSELAGARSSLLLLLLLHHLLFLIHPNSSVSVSISITLQRRSHLASPEPSSLLPAATAMFPPHPPTTTTAAAAATTPAFHRFLPPAPLLTHHANSPCCVCSWLRCLGVLVVRL